MESHEKSWNLNFQKEYEPWCFIHCVYIIFMCVCVCVHASVHVCVCAYACRYIIYLLIYYLFYLFQINVEIYTLDKFRFL